jgi:hypothetical protein
MFKEDTNIMRFNSAIACSSGVALFCLIASSISVSATAYRSLGDGYLSELSAKPAPPERGPIRPPILPPIRPK